jgi:type IV pilus assembly protein PilE
MGESAMSFTKCSKGFSLVELMIVLAIVAILAAVAIPAYHNHVLRTRQSIAYNDLLDLKAAQEMYYAQHNEYADLSDGKTFTSLLSFDIDDDTYYVFDITAADSFNFTADADGKAGTKFAGDCIRITDFADPSTCGSPIGFKFSLMFQ